MKEIIALREVRSFFVGGDLVRLSGLPIREIPTIPGAPLRCADPNGTYAVGQLYVQQYLQANPTASYPVHLWHGGGLTGACWETTPDGRPGWLDVFLRRGFDTYLTDAPERGRASWAPYPTINAEAPWHRTLEMAWWMFRFGPEGGYDPDPAKWRTYPDLKFPVEAAETFLKQFVARWGSRTSDAWAISAYAELLDQSDPGVVVAHSQGGLYALDLAARHPDRLLGLVLVEPVAPRDEQFNYAALNSTPILIVTGDNLTSRPALEAFCLRARAAGSAVKWLDLPQLGVTGNSHMLMMDTNNLAIAIQVLKWMEENISVIASR